MKRISIIVTLFIFLVSCTYVPVTAKLELSLVTDDAYTLDIGDTVVACVYVKHGSSELDEAMLDIRSGSSDIATARLRELTESGYAYVEITAIGGGETDIIVAAEDDSLLIHVAVTSGGAASSEAGESVTSRPAESATTRPAESATEAPIESGSLSDDTTIKIISFTYTVKRGNDACLKLQGYPGHTYSITVEMKSGFSTATGLESKTADENGYVEWIWRVGGKSSTDFQPIVTVRDIANGETLTIKYTVTK